MMRRTGPRRRRPVRKKRRHEQCAFWASVGECDANPSYMRTSCKRACAAHEAKATGDSNEAFFAVADAPETITVRGPERRRGL